MQVSHILRSRPAVTVIYRQLPAALADLIATSSVSSEHVRNTVKLLLASKLAYVSGWTVEVQPIITAGNKPNVPRPTPEAVKYLQLDRRRSTYPTSRAEYQRKYREDNKDKRAAYTAANRERMNVVRNTRMALKRAIAEGQLVAQDAAPVTTWR